MRRFHISAYMLIVVGTIAVVRVPPLPAAEDGIQYRRLAVAEYRDRVAAGWIGQMVGVGWGAPTEFKFKGAIIPADKVPVWKPRMVNQYNQDDLYVEMTFLRSMELHGLDVSIRQAGIDFANSGYRLWHANLYGRENLRRGIAPPDSGHPKFNSHADDIDYQIEADFSGLIAPGMPNVGIQLGEKFGRLMNYGDGLYGGQFVAGMYAEAFFEDDPKKLVEAGLACVPAESQFAETIRDVFAWHAAEPDDWQAVWQHIEDKYQGNMAYRRFSCNQHDGKPNASMDFNIDAKINAAYIVMGLLYGEGGIEKTTVISMRCGQDSDCNPSNATGVLCTTMGMKEIPDRYVSALDRTPKYSHTEYNFDMLVDVCEKLARQAVVQQGGRIEKDADGSEVFVIPVKPTKPSALEQCWEAGPVANSRFTEEEMKRINPPEETQQRSMSAPEIDISGAVAKFAPSWSVNNCGNAMAPGLRAEWGSRKNVLVTHPLSETAPCVLSRSITIPSEGLTTLVLDTAHDPRGDWTLVVKADGKELLKEEVSEATGDRVWRTIRVALSPLAGKTAKVEIENRANDWKYEAAFWSKIAIENGKAAAKNPNVILFLVDDMGWTDLACYGSTFYETPNIDRLASEGVRFTDAYATCHVCSPSRASVLTGKYPARLDLTDWLKGRGEFPFQRLLNAPIHQALPLEEITLAEALRRHGYRTGHFGKWHLGEHPSGPLQQGFDSQVPANWYKGWPKAGYHAPFEFDGIDDQPGDYLTDRLTDEALEFIDDNRDEPFFLYLSHFAVHDPIQGRADLVAKYEQKRSQLPVDQEPFILEGNPDGKISFTRAQREAMIDDPAYAGHRVLPNRMVKIKQRQDNPQFAAMVETVDESLGRVVTKLKSLGLEQNTIIIFTSDNGGMSAANFGHPERVVDPTKLNVAYSTSNLPLRGAKGWLYEGGIRVPLIIKWPSQGMAGSVCDEPVTGTDYYPTILDMIGVSDLPEQHADGESLCPLFHGSATLNRDALYWHFPHYSNHGMQSPGGAIRCGKYKLLEYFENGTIQLFDLEVDPGEQNDLSEKHPEVVAQLLDRLHRWRKDVDAEMMGPNPKFDPSTAVHQ